VIDKPTIETTIENGVVTGITITSPGSGFTVKPAPTGVPAYDAACGLGEREEPMTAVTTDGRRIVLTPPIHQAAVMGVGFLADSVRRDRVHMELTLLVEMDAEDREELKAWNAKLDDRLPQYVPLPRLTSPKVTT
jgi:hypothetical protein